MSRILVSAGLSMKKVLYPQGLDCHILIHVHVLTSAALVFLVLTSVPVGTV